MLNLVSLSTQSLASCVNYFCLELFTVFFQHENRFRYKFFRYCSIFKVLCAAALRLTTWLFYHRSGFLSSTFLRSFWSFLNLERFRFLGISRNFSASIGSFQRLPAEASEVILLSQRLALKYNTTPRGSCQHFLTSFFQFLCGGGLGAKLQPRSSLSGIAARCLRGFSLILLHYIGRANPNRV